jgi:PAS domain S-box-containing protein
MAHKPATERSDKLHERIAELERQNAELRSRMSQHKADARTEAEAGAARDEQQQAALAESRSATATAMSDLRRANAQIERAEARHIRDREHDRAELASAEGIIAALESVQLAARDGEARMRALLRSASDYAIIETDPDGRISFWNNGAEALLGWKQEEALGANAAMIFTPEDREAGAPERERQDASASGRSDTERWHIRKDGSRFYAHERVIASKNEEQQRFLKVLRNRSAEHANKVARDAGEEQMRLILDSATDYAIFTLDREGIITSWNSGGERLVGYEDSEIIGKDARIVFTPEDREKGEPEKEIFKAYKDGRAENERWHMRKDGSRFWGSGLMLPLRAPGTPGFLKIMRDETARHQADEMNRLLVRELSHRVKNTLALVQAIVRETLRGRIEEKEVREALDSRLAALARSHDILARESWEGAHLVEVIRQSLTPFVAHDKFEDRVVLEGEDVRLPPPTTLSLGMGFHELATNAAKYGALSGSDGKVTIRWSQTRSDDGGSLRLTWEEQNGPPVTPPKRKGFGSRLIERALAYEMNGMVKLDYAPNGLRFAISIPEQALREHET